MIAIQASATAVLCISAADRVGAGVGPQADRMVMVNNVRMVGYFLFIFSLRDPIFTTTDGLGSRHIAQPPVNYKISTSWMVE